VAPAGDELLDLEALFGGPYDTGAESLPMLEEFDGFLADYPAPQSAIAQPAAPAIDMKVRIAPVSGINGGADPPPPPPPPPRPPP